MIAGIDLNRKFAPRISAITALEVSRLEVLRVDASSSSATIRAGSSFPSLQRLASRRNVPLDSCPHVCYDSEREVRAWALIPGLLSSGNENAAWGWVLPQWGAGGSGGGDMRTLLFTLKIVQCWAVAALRPLVAAPPFTQARAEACYAPSLSSTFPPLRLPHKMAAHGVRPPQAAESQVDVTTAASRGKLRSLGRCMLRRISQPVKGLPQLPRLGGHHRCEAACCQGLTG